MIGDWEAALGTWLHTGALHAATGFAALVIVSGLLQNAIYIVQLWIAGRALRKRPPQMTPKALWSTYADIAPPIAVIVPAYNESAGIVDSVRSMLALYYPRLEVVVVNDGSSDDTLSQLQDAFALTKAHRLPRGDVTYAPLNAIYRSSVHSNLIVVDKANGGKADALNAGIDTARTPLVLTVDADSILEPDALLRTVVPFIEDPTETVAVGGAIRVVNGCTVRNGFVTEVGAPHRLLALFQTVEYLRAFLMARVAWSRLGALTLISGAFGLFRRDALVAVGGYSHGTVGEDLELVIKLHRNGREAGRRPGVVFLPEPVCWTEAPERLKVLARQRIRWQRGALETWFAHWRMTARPRYGPVGVLGMVNMAISDVLGPILEVLGYLVIPLFWWSGLISWAYVVAFLALTFVFGVALSVGSMVLEELALRRFPRKTDLLLLTTAAVLENFGYRQVNNVWRMVGWWRFARRVKGGWGDMTRTGFRQAKHRR